MIYYTGSKFHDIITKMDYQTVALYLLVLIVTLLLDLKQGMDIVILPGQPTGMDFTETWGFFLKRIFVRHRIYAFAFSEVSMKTPFPPYRLNVGCK